MAYRLSAVLEVACHAVFKELAKVLSHHASGTLEQERPDVLRVLVARPVADHPIGALGVPICIVPDELHPLAEPVALLRPHSQVSVAKKVDGQIQRWQNALLANRFLISLLNQSF